MGDPAGEQQGFAPGDFDNTLSEEEEEAMIDGLDPFDGTPHEDESTVTTINEDMAVPRRSPWHRCRLKYWCYLSFGNSSFTAFIGIVTTAFSWMCSFLPEYGNQLSNSGGTYGGSSSLRKITTGKDRFYADSGANIHATGNRRLISDLTNNKAGTLVKMANVHSPLLSHGCGHVSFENITLPDVHYVPGLGINIVSVSKLTELDYMLMFVPNEGCSILDSRTNELVGKGRAISGLFELDYLRVPLDRA